MKIEVATAKASLVVEGPMASATRKAINLLRSGQPHTHTILGSPVVHVQWQRDSSGSISKATHRAPVIAVSSCLVGTSHELKLRALLTMTCPRHPPQRERWAYGVEVEERPHGHRVDVTRDSSLAHDVNVGCDGYQPFRIP